MHSEMVSSRMNSLDHSLISLGAATFGSYTQRISRLARFEAYHQRRIDSHKHLEAVRERARKEVEDRAAMAAAAHTLCSLKTDCTLFINLPLVADYE